MQAIKSAAGLVMLIFLVAVVYGIYLDEHPRPQPTGAITGIPVEPGIATSRTPYAPSEGITPHSEDAAIDAIKHLYSPSAALMTLKPDLSKGYWIARVATGRSECGNAKDCWEVHYDVAISGASGQASIQAFWLIDLETMDHNTSAETKEYFVEAKNLKNLAALAEERADRHTEALSNALLALNKCIDDEAVYELRAGASRGQTTYNVASKCGPDFIQFQIDSGMALDDARGVLIVAINNEVDRLISNRGK